MDFSEDDTFMQMSVQKINAEVVMDIGAYERQQETMALLKLLSLGKKDLMEERFQSADDFFAEMDAEE